MNRRNFVQAGIFSVAAVATSDHPLFADSSFAAGERAVQAGMERVDFGYAFAPPHRMCIARPEASEKTLLDLEPGQLTMSWSYEDLRTTPLAVDKPPRTAWHVKMQPFIDGKPVQESRWSRGEGYLPMLVNTYQGASGTIQFEAIGGVTGALVRVTMRNSSAASHRFSVLVERLKAGTPNNPAWMETGAAGDSLLACYEERADRVLVVGVGPSEFPFGKSTFTLEWTLAPGEVRTGWVVRPYAAYQADLPELRHHDWADEFERSKKEWGALLGRAVSIEIPDDGVRNGFYACLGDLFIMREPLADGYMGTLCGTEQYRSTNPFEPCIAGIALDQMGLHAEAANGLRVHIDMQEPDGNWSDPKGWCHQMWGSSGMKAWSAMEHFKLTGDRAYLKALFPHLVASSRWQDLQRQKSRNDKSASVGTYGLMPRGMGDGGLMNGTDLYGVFYPHNILAVYADALSVEAAEILGETSQLAELRRIHETGLKDLRAALRWGAMREGNLEWMPGSPKNPTGSRWGTLYALFPARELDPTDPLVIGTLKKIEQNMSPGGQPVHTGWMEDGVWVGITLDNVAEAHLVLGHGDIAAQYLYSSLNHGTPLYTWCEERGQEAHSKKTSGDRQHLWTPVAVVRFVRDALVMEQPDGLHLGLATARSWLAQGQKVGVQSAPTHFGEVSYEIESDVDHGAIRASVTPPGRQQSANILLHLRHPTRARLTRVTVNGVETSAFDAARETVELSGKGERFRVEAWYAPRLS